MANADELVLPTSVQLHPTEELEKGLREVRLRRTADGEETAQPYKESKIEFLRHPIGGYARPQRYVLASQLAKLQKLRHFLLENHGQDILALNGFLRLHYEDGTTRDILPPVVERDRHNEHTWLVCDGMHRCYLAFMTMQPITLARICEPSVDYYAYPLAGCWSDTEVIDDTQSPGWLPPGYIKKFHRRSDYKRYYRDFNTAFRNVGDSRPVQQRDVAGLPII